MLKSLTTWQKLILVGLIFAASRIFIYLNPPENFSDVTTYYERYANMWRYGLQPYRQHLFEYPPAAVPLISFPLDLDQQGIGKYYPNYRFQILVIDSLFFAVLVWISSKISWVKKKRWSLLLWYTLLGLVAKDFLYEGVDLAFMASFSLAAVTIGVGDSQKFSIKVLSWIFFWLSTAVKFLTLPLLIPMWLVQRSNFKNDLAAMAIGFLVIWGLPLMIYRSSLSVSFVYNNSRPIKYASFPAHLIRGVDLFTKSETQVMQEPDFEYVGPVSTQVTKVVKVIFPISVLLVIGWSLKWRSDLLSRKKSKWSGVISLQFVKQVWQMGWGRLSQLKAEERLFYLLKVYGVYIFTLFFAAKIFSQPFHIWYFALILLLPWGKKLKWVALAMLLMVIFDTTTWLHLPAGLSDQVGDRAAEFIKYLRDLSRYLPMGLVFYLLAKLQLPQSKLSK